MSENNFKIAFLTLYPNTLSSRYRVYEYLPYFNKSGVDIKVYSAVSKEEFNKYYNSTSLINRWKYHFAENENRKNHLVEVKDADVIVVQKGFTLINWKKWLPEFQNLNIPIFYDIDDAVFLSPPAKAPKLLRNKEDENFYYRIISQSKGILAGNKKLVEYVSELNSNVLLQPTSINTDKYQPKSDYRKKEKIIIGWIGTPGTRLYLNLLDQVFTKLDSFPIEFHVISDKLDGINRENIPNIKLIEWSPETELNALQNLDIGIMPIPDNEWTRYKCSFKLIQYMGMGIPAIGSAVGNNLEVIESGKNGFLAKSEDEWVEYLNLLCKDAGLREKLGIEGRKTIEAKYSFEVNAPKMIEFLKDK